MATTLTQTHHRYTAPVVPVVKASICGWCDSGDRPELLDKDGVLSSLSGEPGTWCHAWDVYWWPCKAPTVAEREAAYQAALKLVERIERNLRSRYRVLYWRVSDKAQLTTVMEVINAYLADDLLLPDEPV